MRPFLVLLLLFLFGGELAAQSPCPSRRAGPKDHSQGTNDIVEYNGGSFSKRIHGKVTDQAESPIPGGTIIIVVRYSPKEETDAYTLARTLPRFRAFLPSRNGRYCITGLPPGRYVFQIGMLQQRVFNDIFVKIRVRKQSARVRAVIKRNFELPLGS